MHFQGVFERKKVIVKVFNGWLSIYVDVDVKLGVANMTELPQVGSVVNGASPSSFEQNCSPSLNIKTISSLDSELFVFLYLSGELHTQLYHLPTCNKWDCQIHKY